jgi:hypothetical protein
LDLRQLCFLVSIHRPKLGFLLGVQSLWIGLDKLVHFRRNGAALLAQLNISLQMKSPLCG